MEHFGELLHSLATIKDPTSVLLSLALILALWIIYRLLDK